MVAQCVVERCLRIALAGGDLGRVEPGQQRPGAYAVTDVHPDLTHDASHLEAERNLALVTQRAGGPDVGLRARHSHHLHLYRHRCTRRCCCGNGGGSGTGIGTGWGGRAFHGGSARRVR